MRKYLYFISADAAFLQTRLERLARRGLELTDTDGLFTGNFEQTARQDLAYLVAPYGKTKNFPRTEDFQPFGWELIGGFNGMAIFKSLPCVEPDREGVLQKLERDGCLHPDRSTVPLTTALLTAFAVFLCLAPHLYPALQQSWYSAYWALGFVVFRGVVVAVAAANLLLLRTYPAAWVHGLTLVILLGALFLWLLLAQLDATAHTAEFIVVPLLLTVACALALWRRCRPLGLGMSGLCLLVLCLGLLFPNADQAELSGKILHNSVADQPVLSLADLGDESSLTGTGYETDGTFLARRTVYWEMSETDSVSSEVYRCLTAGIAQAILADELDSGGWTEIDGGWSKNDSRTVLLCDGRTVALLTWSESFDAQALELAAANVF